MFGSRQEPELMGGRKIVWELEHTAGVPLSGVLPQLISFFDSYPGDKSALRFGYWEYGDSIVVTEPER
jgi:hypothetical protein